jgi:hypothetical protein
MYQTTHYLDHTPSGQPTATLCSSALDSGNDPAVSFVTAASVSRTEVVCNFLISWNAHRVDAMLDSRNDLVRRDRRCRDEEGAIVGFSCE